MSGYSESPAGQAWLWLGVLVTSAQGSVLHELIHFIASVFSCLGFFVYLPLPRNRATRGVDSFLASYTGQRWAASPQKSKVHPSPLLQSSWISTSLLLLILSPLSSFLAGHVCGRAQKPSSFLGGVQSDDVIKTEARVGQGCTAFAIFQTQICLFFCCH